MGFIGKMIPSQKRTNFMEETVNRFGTPFALFWLFVLAAATNSFGWRIPDTGQTKCYDEAGAEIPCDGTGQDGDYLINPPSYTKLDANGNDLEDDATEWFMVRDNVTGLIWEVKQNKDEVKDYSNPHDADNTYTWYDSNPDTNFGDAGTPGEGTDTEDFINQINDNNFGGFSDWRLSSGPELRTLLDYDSTGLSPRINNFFFPNTVWDDYWTSDQGVPSNIYEGYRRYVSFSTSGDYASMFTNANYFVRAVRGPKRNQNGSLINNSDGTVTDSRTGLMWTRKSFGGKNWEDAVSFCTDNTLAFYSDWRLPSVRALSSITVLNRRIPSVDTVFFPEFGFRQYKYWGSTKKIVSGNLLYPYIFSFFDGEVNYEESYDEFSLICVRGGQDQITTNLAINQPRQASFWNAGGTLPIRWDTANIGGNVVISISYEGGRPGSFQTIAANTPNDGQYDWSIADRFSPNCVLKIEPVSDPSRGTVQGLFTILNILHANPSSVSLKEPENSTDAPESETVTVLLARNPGAPVELELASSNPGECSVFPTSITLGIANWDTGIEVTVTPEYDGIADGDQATSILASTQDSFGPFQAKDFPLVRVMVQDTDSRKTLKTAFPSVGEAGHPLGVRLQGTNFDEFTKIYILPEGGTATQISPVTLESSSSLSVTIPAQVAGNYNLKAGNAELKNAISFVDSSSADALLRKKALLVAGGGPFWDNAMWLATRKCVAKAYETLLASGYQNDAILLFSGSLWRDLNGDGENDVEGGASLANLENAIDGLNSGGTDELLLYLVGPSGSGSFQFGSDNSAEYLSPSLLDGWLDDLQQEISGRVIVIYDASQSGVYLPHLQPPDGKERIVITGAAATEPAWFLDDGEISFSYRLFENLFFDGELFSAFDNAKTDISQFQTPRIDASGDGAPDLRNRRETNALIIGRGRNVEIAPPEIASLAAIPSILDDGSTTSTLTATGVNASAGLSRIWCRIIPPISVLRNPSEPVLTVPTVKLFESSGGGYDSVYEEFWYDGQYRAMVYAIDRAGSKSFPQQATVTQNKGIPMDITPGDVNADGHRDIADAIRALQTAAGKHAHAIKYADADGDGRIGMEDAVFILQKVGEVRP
jgi:hypothetical protein